MKTIKREIEPLREYPWIGISPSEIVVLFSSPGSGTILHQGNHKLGGIRNIGDYSSLIVEKNFSPFKGEIVLSNYVEIP